jgi:hypothetical protein
MKDYVKMSVAFPREYYPLLKMLLAENNKTFKDLVIELLMNEINKGKKK